MKIRNYLFLLRANFRCYECHRRQPVVALGTSDLYDYKYGWLPATETNPPFILSEVSSIPPEIIDLVRSTGVIYDRSEDSADGDTCFANWCINCGARFGDFYLIKQPRAPFFPETMAAASKIELLEIPLASELEIDCAYSHAAHHMVRPHVRKFRNQQRPRSTPSDASQW